MRRRSCSAALTSSAIGADRTPPISRPRARACWPSTRAGSRRVTVANWWSASASCSTSRGITARRPRSSARRLAAQARPIPPLASLYSTGGRSQSTTKRSARRRRPPAPLRAPARPGRARGRGRGAVGNGHVLGGRRGGRDGRFRPRLARGHCRLGPRAAGGRHARVAPADLERLVQQVVVPGRAAAWRPPPSRAGRSPPCRPSGTRSRSWGSGADARARGPKPTRSIHSRRVGEPGRTPGYFCARAAASVAALSANCAANTRFFTFNASSACWTNRFAVSYCARRFGAQRAVVGPVEIPRRLAIRALMLLSSSATFDVVCSGGATPAGGWGGAAPSGFSAGFSVFGAAGRRRAWR